MCAVTSLMTITRARIEMHIPRKRRGSCTNHDKVSFHYTSSHLVCYNYMYIRYMTGSREIGIDDNNDHF